MSEYACPKCGGELDSQPQYVGNFLCIAEVKWFSHDYLDGYWTRDREEQEKRCDGCNCYHAFPDLTCGRCDWDVEVLGDVEGDFRCKFWEAK